MKTKKPYTPPHPRTAWGKAIEQKKQDEWNFRALQWQTAPTAVMNIPSPQRDKYYQALYKLWYKAEGSEELMRFYTTRFPPNFLYNVNNFYNRAVGSDVPFMHYNLPQVITKAMADLVFAKNPVISAMTGNEDLDGDTDKAIHDIWDDNDEQNLLRKAAQLESYSGAVGIKIVLDPEISDYPIFQLYPKEQVETVDKYGRITEIIFKDYYPVDDQGPGGQQNYVLRSHYGRGYIKYDLWNEEENIAFLTTKSEKIPLSTVPGLSDLKDIEFKNPDGTPSDLILGYYKENKENAKSDYSGILDDFEALDEIYSNMMDFVRKSKIKTYYPENTLIKDINAASGRSLVVPDAYDTSNIPVRDTNPNTSNYQIKRDVIQETQQTFKGYSELFQDRVQTTLSTCGLSLSTVAYDNGNAGKYITNEVSNTQERHSLRTRDEKISRWTSAIQYVTDAALQAYAAKETGGSVTLNQGIGSDNVHVSFPEYDELPIQEKVLLIIQKLNAGLMTKEDAWKELYPDVSEEDLKKKISEADSEAAEKQKTEFSLKQKFTAADAKRTMDGASKGKIADPNNKKQRGKDDKSDD